MKRVGIITFQWVENDNYGAILQAYALHKTIIGLGFNSEVIDYLPSFAFNNNTNSIRNKSLNNREIQYPSILDELIQKRINIIKAYARNILLEKKNTLRRQRFADFHDQFLTLSHKKSLLSG